MTIQPHDSAAANRATPSLKMVIGGEFVDAADGQTFDVVSTVTGHAIVSVPKGAQEVVDRAVAAAQAAFDGEWHTWSQTRRGQTLARLAAGLGPPTAKAEKDTHAIP